MLIEYEEFKRECPGFAQSPYNMRRVETAALVELVARQLIRGETQSITESNANMRYICNMLGIDYFGDLWEFENAHDAPGLRDLGLDL